MAQITMRDVNASAKRCQSQLEQLGYTVPTHTQYRISPRMTRALGNCAVKFNRMGEKLRVVISISKDLPVHLLDNTMIHEQIHAVLPVREGHGYRFQALAREVNRTYGYKVSTYASEEVSREVSALRVENGSKVQVACSCGKTHIVTKQKASKIMSNPTQYGCRGCGRYGQFSVV